MSKCGAVVVLSGGADSTISLFWAKANFHPVIAVSFDYGQSHRVEVEAAGKIARIAKVNLEIVDLRNVLRSISPLLDKGSKLETYSDFNTMSDIIGDRVELTFVPLRNTLFLTVAANRAVYFGYTDIVTGVCQADGANYPDCTQTFIDLMVNAIVASLQYDFRIHTPLMNFTKAESVIEAFKYEGCYAALAYSHTAYSGEFPPVTQDHATVLRAYGFEASGYPDPMIVRAYWENKLSALPSTLNYAQYASILDDIPNNEDIYRKLSDLECYFRSTL